MTSKQYHLFNYYYYYYYLQKRKTQSNIDVQTQAQVDGHSKATDADVDVIVRECWRSAAHFRLAIDSTVGLTVVVADVELAVLTHVVPRECVFNVAKKHLHDVSNQSGQTLEDQHVIAIAGASQDETSVSSVFEELAFMEPHTWTQVIFFL